MQKLRLDLAVSRGMCGGMSSEPDSDALDLGRNLCTRAGMLLEDASAVAVLAGDGSRDELLVAIQEARELAQKAATLLSAAAALLKA